MNEWSKTIVFCVAMICLTILATSLSPALSQQQQRKSGFMIATGSTTFAWRVNTFTGSVSFCARRNSSNDPSLVQRSEPYCSQGSPAIE